MSARAPKASAHKHALDRARARGFAAAKDGTPNPYPYGSYCWIEFERGKARGRDAGAPGRRGVSTT